MDVLMAITTKIHGPRLIRQVRLRRFNMDLTLRLCGKKYKL
jgi:hypothetical protein